MVVLIYGIIILCASVIGAIVGIGGGGLGNIAIMYGYMRYNYMVILIAVVLLIVLVQVFQSAGTAISVKTDKRLK